MKTIVLENMTILYIIDLLRRIYIGNLNSVQLSDSTEYILRYRTERYGYYSHRRYYKNNIHIR